MCFIIHIPCSINYICETFHRNMLDPIVISDNFFQLAVNKNTLTHETTFRCIQGFACCTLKPIEIQSASYGIISARIQAGIGFCVSRWRGTKFIPLTMRYIQYSAKALSSIFTVNTTSRRSIIPSGYNAIIFIYNNRTIFSANASSSFCYAFCNFQKVSYQ